MTSKMLMMARVNFLPLLVYGSPKITGKIISFSLSFYLCIVISFFPFFLCFLTSIICSSFHYSSPRSFLPVHRAITISLSRCFVPLPLPYLYLVYSFPIPLICSPCRHCCLVSQQREKLFYVFTVHQQCRVGCFPKLDNHRLLFISRCLAVLLLKRTQPNIYLAGGLLRWLQNL
jgi:hypothetical protein